MTAKLLQSMIKRKKKKNHIIKLTQYTKSETEEAQPIVNLWNIYIYIYSTLKLDYFMFNLIFKLAH